MAVKSQVISYSNILGDPTDDSTLDTVLSNLQDNELLSNLRAGIDGTWTVWDIQAGAGDVFTDETGIGTSTLTYVGAGDYYDTSISDGAITSVAFTAASAPTYIRLVALHDPQVAVTLNTDIIFAVSRDNGSTWTNATMTNDITILTSLDVLISGDIDVSAQPSGTSIKVRATTANTKLQRVNGWALCWR
jgi:hypothetical protein